MTIVLLTFVIQLQAVSEENWKEGDASAIYCSVFLSGWAEQPTLYVKVMNEIYIYVCVCLFGKEMVHVALLCPL